MQTILSISGAQSNTTPKDDINYQTWTRISQLDVYKTEVYKIV